MAQQWALIGNIVIACAYAAICMAIVVPVVRAGQLRTNRLAVATALIFFSCAVGHALHAAAYWTASFDTATMPGMHDLTGWSLWPTAVWDTLTAVVGIYYWTLRRSYAVLLGGTGALFVDPAEQQRRHDIELRERVADARADAEAERDVQAAMLAAVIANSQSLIYVKDLDGHYLLANTTFETAFQLQPGEIIGHTDEYLDPQRAPATAAPTRDRSTCGKPPASAPLRATNSRCTSPADSSTPSAASPSTSPTCAPPCRPPNTPATKPSARARSKANSWPP